LGDFKKYLRKVYLKELKTAKCVTSLKSNSELEKMYTDKVNPIFFSKLNKFLFETGVDSDYIQEAGSISRHVNTA